MTIYFVELDPADERYFREATPGHEIFFVERLEEVKEDAELLCVFINHALGREFLEAHPRLLFIATRSGATDHLDLQACGERGVLVSTVPGFGDATVAEHTFALILSLSRRIRESMAATLHPVRGQPVRFSYEATRGVDLEGKTLGILGMGRAGLRVQALGLAFGMRTVAWDPLEMPPELGEERGFTWAPLPEVLAQAHVLTLHLRLTRHTRHLLNRETFALCRPGFLLVNTARGALVDTEALAEALESGQVGGAGLDVLEHEQVLRAPASQIISDQIIEHLRGEGEPAAEVPPDDRLRHLRQIVDSDALLARRNVVFTPHVAFNSVEAIDRLFAGTAANLQAFLRGEPIHLAEPDREPPPP